MPPRKRRRPSGGVRDYLEGKDPLTILLGTLLSAMLGATGLRGTNELSEIRKELIKVNATIDTAMQRLEDHERRVSNLETLYLHPGNAK